MGKFFNFVFHFFHGWRRKAGCVTLAMACSLLSPWNRSLTNLDWLDVPVSRQTSIVFVSCLQFCCLATDYDSDFNLVWADFSRGYTRLVIGPDDFMDWNAVEFMVRSEIDSLHDRKHPANLFMRLGQHESGKGKNCRIIVWSVPYWSIILALTLLSAWLILSKPRSSKSNKPVETTPKMAS